MPAYNRVTQSFQDFLDLDASDLNASRDDMKRWVLQQLANFSPVGTTTTSHVLARQGGAVLSRDGSTLTFR